MALSKDDYTIEQAAIRLTETFGEKVSAGDVQRLVETERIIPVFRLDRVYAICGRPLINYMPGKLRYEDVRPVANKSRIQIEGMYSPFNIPLVFDTNGQLDICYKGYLIPALYEVYEPDNPMMAATETPTYQVVEPCVISVRDMLITKMELERFEAKNRKLDCKPSLPSSINTTDDSKVEKKNLKRHIFTEEQRTKSDRKGCLQYAVEKYLDMNVDGQWEGFKTFLENKLKLPTEELLCKKQTYNFYFEKVNKHRICLKHPKSNKSNDYDYSSEYVGSIIRKEKNRRKKLAGKIIRDVVL